MTISAKLQEVYASAPPDIDYIETLEFSHSNFVGGVRVLHSDGITRNTHYFTNSNEEWLLLKEDTSYDAINPEILFRPFPFKLALPGQEEGSNNELSVVLANAGLEMMSELELAQLDPTEQIKVVYRVYLNFGGTKPEIDPPLTLHVTDLSADDSTLTMTANRFDILSRQFPKVIYTTDMFAGLKR